MTPDTSHIKATARVAESPYRKATGDGPQSVTAAIFWLKTRGHWREICVQETHAVIAVEPMTEEEWAARYASHSPP